MPFLSIITRHMLSRPNLLLSCRSSIRGQTDADLEHIVLADEIGRGIAWANMQFYHHRNIPQGEYVLMLDDDDYLATPYAVEMLKRVVELAREPDIVVFRDLRAGLGKLPSEAVWRSRMPIANEISGQDFIVRRDVWYDNIWAFGLDYGGDFQFMEALWESRPTVTWFDEVLVASDWQGMGRGE